YAGDGRGHQQPGADGAGPGAPLTRRGDRAASRHLFEERRRLAPRFLRREGGQAFERFGVVGAEGEDALQGIDLLAVFVGGEAEQPPALGIVWVGFERLRKQNQSLLPL